MAIILSMFSTRPIHRLNPRLAILALVEEMKANIENPNYDMAAAVKRLQQSPYVVYTLNHFDPEFPIVFRTGDAAKDLEAYNAAKAEWLAKQNN